MSGQCISAIEKSFSFSSDLDNATDRSLTVASSIATVLSKNFKAKSSSNEHLVDRCPTFVSKEKRKTFFGGLKAKKTLQV